MSPSLNLAHYADLLNQLNAWVCTYPMTTAFRESTTYREFGQLIAAKQAELGLTPEIWSTLSHVHGDADLDTAWLEYGMTLDSREVICPSYFLDLPMNAYWMAAYDPLMKAVDDFIDTHCAGTSISDEALAEVVRQHMPVTSA